MLNFPIADSHVHTVHSFDGESTLRQQLEAACAMGVRAITITDHLECNMPEDIDCIPRIQACLEELELLRPQFPELIILRGAEFGQSVQCPQTAKLALERFELDFVLASLHNTSNDLDFYYVDFTETDPKKAFRKYLVELLETVQWGNFDSLAHLTYPLRYITGKYSITLPQEEFSREYDEILSLLAETDRALEVNTSALKNGGALSPDLPLIRRFRELGGRLITLGSDAHNARHLCCGFEQAKEVLLTAGFDSYVYYQKHKAIELALR